jgi:hypothetical protein
VTARDPVHIAGAVRAQHERLGVFHAAAGIEQIADGAHRVQHAQLVSLAKARQQVADLLARTAVQRLVDDAAMIAVMCSSLARPSVADGTLATRPALSNLARMRLR